MSATTSQGRSSGSAQSKGDGVGGSGGVGAGPVKVDAAKRRLGRGLSSLLGGPVAVSIPGGGGRVGGGVGGSGGAVASMVDTSSVVASGSSGGSDTREEAGSGERGARGAWGGGDSGGVPRMEGGPVAAVSQAMEIAPAAGEGSGGEVVGRRMVLAAVSSIEPSPFQPRRSMDEEGLKALAESIRSAGVMQPILVRPRAGGRGGYELIAGERRWRAAERAGLTHVPAVVGELSDAEAAQWALVENVQREELSVIEKAHALANLSGRFGLTHAEIADKVGLERSSVTNQIRLTELEDPIQRLIETGRLSGGHGKALLGMRPGAARVAIAERAALGRWPVRRLEREAGEDGASGTSGAGGGGAGGGIDPVTGWATPAERAETEAVLRARARALNVAEVERRLAEHLGTKVQIRTDRSGKRGRLVVRFYGVDQFEGLLEKLGVNPVEGGRVGGVQVAKW